MNHDHATHYILDNFYDAGNPKQFLQNHIHSNNTYLKVENSHYLTLTQIHSY